MWKMNATKGYKISKHVIHQNTLGILMKNMKKKKKMDIEQLQQIESQNVISLLKLVISFYC